MSKVKVEGIKSKCCNAEVHKSYDKFSQDIFWCDKCDKECDFYEVSKVKEKILAKKTKKHRHKFIKDWQDDCPNCGWCGEYKFCECGEIRKVK